jgi:hypothetical protein
MQPDDAPEGGPTLTFHNVYPAAIPPMRADKSALGTMPTMVFRHCEPMRTASSFGWYIFPPEDITLRWNGADVFYLDSEEEWQPLSQVQLPGFSDHWDANVPPDMQGLSPPYLTLLPMRGFVQIWSGLLCSTKKDWSLLVRPLANIRGSNQFVCYEGLLESDRFQPFPLFMNIQLLATDTPITIPKAMPLFQVQPLMRATYGDQAHSMDERDGLGLMESGEPSMRPEDWTGYRKTIRVEEPGAMPEAGQYANATRKRNKHEP